MPEYKVHYFNGKGRAEMIRLVLTAAGQKFEDIRIDGDWAERKQNYPFGQLPVLEVDGKMYGQSVACANFIAKEFGLYGKTNVDGVMIDQVVGLLQDFFQAAIKFFFEKDEAKKAELKQNFQEKECPKFYGNFETMLKNNGTGFFVGSEMSLADIVVFDMASGMLQSTLPPMDGFPLLKALTDKIGEVESIKAYVAGRPDTPF